MFQIGWQSYLMGGKVAPVYGTRTLVVTSQIATFFFRVCVLCVQLMAHAWTHVNASSAKTPLRCKHRTVIAFTGRHSQSASEMMFILWWFIIADRRLLLCIKVNHDMAMCISVTSIHTHTLHPSHSHFSHTLSTHLIHTFYTPVRCPHPFYPAVIAYSSFLLTMFFN